MPETANATAPSTAPVGDAAQGAQSTNTASNSPTDKVVGEALGTEAPKKKYKLKYRDVEEEFDEDKVVSLASQARGSQKAFQEAKKLRDEAEAIKAKYDAFKDPKRRKEAIRELLGEDFDAVAEESLIERMEKEKAEEGMSERDKYWKREIERRDAELNEHRAAREKQEQARQQSIEEATYQGIAGQIDLAALETMKELNVPQALKPVVAQRMVKYIEAMLENKMPLDPQAIRHFTMEEIREEHRMLTDPMEGEALIKHLGPSVVKKIRDYDLAQYEARRNGKTPQAQPSKTQARPTNGEPVDNRKGIWAELEKQGIRRP